MWTITKTMINVVFPHLSCVGFPPPNTERSRNRSADGVRGMDVGVKI